MARNDSDARRALAALRREHMREARALQRKAREYVCPVGIFNSAYDGHVAQVADYRREAREHLLRAEGIAEALDALPERPS